MLEQINALLEGIGECALIEPWAEDRWHAALYLRADFNDSTRVAEWFHKLGAKKVAIDHTLYCDINGDRDGVIPDTESKAWAVYFDFDGEI